MLTAATSSNGVFAPYGHRAVASILSLAEADRFVSDLPNFTDFLDKFKALANESGKADTFGVTLVHRHFDIPDGHRLFDLKQTLQPIPCGDDDSDVNGCAFRPKSMYFQQNRWYPYEFEFGQVTDETEEAFLVAVGRLIVAMGMEHLGLRRYNPGDPEELEVTGSNGLSLKLPVELLSAPPEKAITTFWAYPNGGFREYKCRCTDTGNHNHIHQP